MLYPPSRRVSMSTLGLLGVARVTLRIWGKLPGPTPDASPAHTAVGGWVQGRCGCLLPTAGCAASAPATSACRCSIRSQWRPHSTQAGLMSGDEVAFSFIFAVRTEEAS